MRTGVGHCVVRVSCTSFHVVQDHFFLVSLSSLSTAINYSQWHSMVRFSDCNYSCSFVLTRKLDVAEKDWSRPIQHHLRQIQGSRTKWNKSRRQSELRIVLLHSNAWWPLNLSIFEYALLSFESLKNQFRVRWVSAPLEWPSLINDERVKKAKIYPGQANLFTWSPFYCKQRITQCVQVAYPSKSPCIRSVQETQKKHCWKREGEGGHNIDQQKQTMDLMIGLAEREGETVSGTREKRQ